MTMKLRQMKKKNQKHRIKMNQINLQKKRTLMQKQQKNLKKG